MQIDDREAPSVASINVRDEYGSIKAQRLIGRIGWFGGLHRMLQRRHEAVAHLVCRKQRQPGECHQIMDISDAVPIWTGRRDAVKASIACPSKKLVECDKPALRLSAHWLAIDLLQAENVGRASAGLNVSARVSSGTRALGGRSKLSKLNVAIRMALIRIFWKED